MKTPQHCYEVYVRAGGILNRDEWLHRESAQLIITLKSQLERARFLLAGIGLDTTTGRVAIRQDQWFDRRDALLAEIQKEGTK